MQQNARAAMDLITREVRMAGFDPTGAGFSGVHHHSGYIHIRADLNGDGDKDDTNEDLRYRYDNTNNLIERDDDDHNNWTPLTENIQAFNFNYLDRNGNPTTTSADIRQILITITARTAESDRNYPNNGGYRTYLLTSLVTPRNLAY
jgi:type IV pilus assembly protein PilW